MFICYSPKTIFFETQPRKQQLRETEWGLIHSAFNLVCACVCVCVCVCVCSISTDDFMARFVDREKQGEGQVNQTIICQIIFFFSKKKKYIYIYIYNIRD